MGSHAGGGPGAKKEKMQDPPVEHDLLVTLEDICKGVTKRMKISRRVVGNDGSVRKEEKVLNHSRLDFYQGVHSQFDCRQVLTINVKPGWKSGTKITFQREGDQAPNKIPADIVFIIRDKPHALFKREGCDLKYTAKVSLKEVGSEFASLIENYPPFPRFVSNLADKINLHSYRRRLSSHIGNILAAEALDLRLK